VTKTLRRIGPVAAIVAMALTAAACASGDNTEPGATSKALSGSVLIDGSSTVAPLTNVAAELYREEQATVQVPVGVSGTGGGFEKFCKGETDISDASRAIKDAEKEACTAGGVAFTELHVSNDALSVVVNKENTWVDCLTVDQLKKIWEPNSKVATWNQIDPSFPNEPLKLFGPGTDSGTFDYFTAEINGKEGQSRADYTASENDNVLVQGVEGSKGGLGYFGLSYYLENEAKLKAVKVDSGKACVAPSLATAQDGTYTPLARPLYIYVSNKSFTSKPQVADFVKFYVANIDDVITEAGFVPLNAAQKTELTTASGKLG
jgi:phosphate transport system substrate-binding protein